MLSLSTIDELEERLSAPTAETVRALADLDGDVLALGAGGKMGPALARMTCRASEAAGSSRRVFAASRFSDPQAQQSLEAAGVETLAGDLLDRRFVDGLPDCPNLVFLAGRKFGTDDNSGETWATNVFLPGLVCQRFAGSRIAALSTGNVYGLVDAAGPGSREEDSLDPVGEYAQSALGRERIFDYFSHRHGTTIAVIRLNYAAELRYGVFVDLGKRILAGEPVELDMGRFNVVWQGDACNQILCSLLYASSPLAIFNVTGRESLSIRAVAERLAAALDRPVEFVGVEGSRALLSDSSRAERLLGRLHTTVDDMIDWTAQWLRAGGATWSKPTHFEVVNGRF